MDPLRMRLVLWQAPKGLAGAFAENETVHRHMEGRRMKDVSWEGKSPRRVFREVVVRNRWWNCVDSRVGSDVGAAVRAYVESGRELPDHLKPGYLLRHAT